MEINITAINENRSKKFLLPILKCYGSVVAEKLAQLFKCAIGVRDDFRPDLTGCNLFILYDSIYQEERTNHILSWLKSLDMFVADYCYDSDISGRLRMLVVKFPKEHLDVYLKFIRGEYSLMFGFDDALMIYDKPKDLEACQIILKSNESFSSHKKAVKKEFDIDDIDEFTEHDFPPKCEEEIFNNTQKDIYLPVNIFV